MKIHFMQHGRPVACTGEPQNNFPQGEAWSPMVEDVTCPKCLEALAAQGQVTYALVFDAPGKVTGITCLHCNLTSYNPNDIERHFCGKCKVFHDDIWPPARHSWINRPAERKP